LIAEADKLDSGFHPSRVGKMRSTYFIFRTEMI